MKFPAINLTDGIHNIENKKSTIAQTKAKI
jgi:hypothetical protein